MQLKIFVLISLGILSGCVSANNDEKCFKDSKSLITNLYKTFPVNGNKIVESADKKTISKFFNNQLTTMLLNDYKCRGKSNGVCNIDFNILNNSQDDLGEFNILQATNNIVTVKFDTPTHGEFIDFLIESKGECKVVKNIQYNNANLLDLLRK
ncbi:TPA: hypothetical protein JIZ13_10510 [Acinetobacter nosocomialis]|uniref:hypothetical protein n=1 Tax=Acinetobacter calcoaceticus/baumannii complex TaxID=909768 RepID=UPI0002AE80AB|nr:MULTISPECIES: hypothetical protein [Acinetobacter calcoaceticus/baumannii complex]ARG15356.1 hypothetical protein B7L44_01315 [Acinetobacter nosocomialis]AWL17655.1 hypothetical protein DIW83_00595 [Acinetobacter nosocomialis]ELW77509.1 hypothetical protein ACIN5021_3865 [Acinetobacter sp. OIFC021]EXE50587.1 hypothetical protein J576_1750 [Acinetobacter sp. 766875]EXH76903.1 hypothetical protein J633_1719 [Acinetobacter sp. 216872]